MEKRNLDRIYFRIERNNKFDNVCFSDLTENEMNEVLANKDKEWLISLCKGLGNTIKSIGEQLDIYIED